VKFELNVVNMKQFKHGYISACVIIRSICLLMSLLYML